VMGFCMGRWGGHGRDGLMYGAMGRTMWRWAGRIREREVYGAMEWAHERTFGCKMIQASKIIFLT